MSSSRPKAVGQPTSSFRQPVLRTPGSRRRSTSPESARWRALSQRSGRPRRAVSCRQRSTAHAPEHASRLPASHSPGPGSSAAPHLRYSALLPLDGATARASNSRTATRARPEQGSRSRLHVRADAGRPLRRAVAARAPIRYWCRGDTSPGGYSLTSRPAVCSRTSANNSSGSKASPSSPTLLANSR